MVIDDSVLVKLINKAFKKGGYTVYRSEENVLSISGDDWLVEINWERVPDKVIGLVAQHMRALPEIGEAFTIQKGADQTVISAMAPGFPEAPKNGPLITATLLTYSGLVVWQSEKMNIVMVDEDVSDLLFVLGNQCFNVQNGIAVSGSVSRAFIQGRFFLEDDMHTKAAVELAKTNWI